MEIKGIQIEKEATLSLSADDTILQKTLKLVPENC